MNGLFCPLKIDVHGKGRRDDIGVGGREKAIDLVAQHLTTKGSILSGPHLSRGWPQLPFCGRLKLALLNKKLRGKDAAFELLDSLHFSPIKHL
jgi:hypothetical protein